MTKNFSGDLVGFLHMRINSTKTTVFVDILEHNAYSTSLIMPGRMPTQVPHQPKTPCLTLFRQKCIL